VTAVGEAVGAVVFPLWARLVLAGLALVGLIWFGFWVAGLRADRDAALKAVEQRDRTAGATSTQIGDLSAAQAERQVVEVRISQDRAAALAAFSEARNADPSVRAFTDHPIPQRLRDIARARREARDGSGTRPAGGGGAAAPP
jgi:hypothetical protein